MKHTILYILFAWICVSCSHHQLQVVERTVHDSINIFEERHDTLIWIDSVWQNVFVKGDTVFSEKEKYRTIYCPQKVYVRTYESHVDSIPYPVEVPAKLSKKEQLQMRVGKAVLKYANIALVLFLLATGLYFARGLRKR